jgi:hypothetical protein
MMFVLIVAFYTFLPPILSLISLKLSQEILGYSIFFGPEVLDRFSFIILLLLLLTSFFCKPYFSSLNNRSKFFEITISITLMIFLIGLFFKNDPSKMNTQTIFWNGFDVNLLPVFLVVFIAVSLLITLFHFNLISINRKKLNYLIVILSFSLILFYIPTLIQFENSEFDSYHYLFTLNELASGSVGFFPPLNYTTQYSNFFGYLPYLFPFFQNSIGSFYIYVNLLNLVTLGISFFILYFYSGNNLGKLILLFLPTIFVRGDLNFESIGTIVTFPGSFPFRILPILLFAIILVAKINLSHKSKLIDPLLSLFAFILLLNNPETGIVGILSLILTLSFYYDFNYIFRLTLKVALSYLVVFLMLTFISLYFFQVNWFNNWLFYVLRFSGGFYSLPSDIFGFHNLIFGIALTSIIIARTNLSKKNSLPNSHLIAIFFSTQMILTSPYYFNRSSYTGQLQFIYILSSFVFLYILINLLNKSINFNSNFTRIVISSFIVTVLVMPIFQSPNLKSNIDRLSKSKIEPERFNTLSMEIKNFLLANGVSSSELYLIVNNGNLISLTSGFRSILPQNSIDDMVPDYVTGEIKNNRFTCSVLKSYKNGYFLLEEYNGIYSEFSGSNLILKMCEIQADKVYQLQQNPRYSIFKLNTAS